MKSLAMALGAAMMFTVGGVFMKSSSGLTRLAPTAAVIALFIGGAALNTMIVHRGGELGVAYLAVVGCETMLAFTLGAVIYGEQITPVRLVAVALIAAGTLLIASSEHDSSRATTFDTVADFGGRPISDAGD